MRRLVRRGHNVGTLSQQFFVRGLLDTSEMARNAMTHKTFGTIEQLNSGKYRARYKHPHTGERISAPITYKNKTDARLWLGAQELAIQQGTWRDTRLMSDTVDSYGGTWIQQRDIKASTRDDYLHVWRNHISPFIGATRLQDLTPEQVRAWYHSRLQAGAGKRSVGIAYSVLSAVCNTALREQIIKYNPCQIEGARKPRTQRRVPMTGDQVLELVQVVAPRYRALVLFLALTGLRIGEATALTRSDLHLEGDRGSVTVHRRVKANRAGGGFNFDTPKTQAGYRTIEIPSYLIPVLQEHLDTFVKSDPTSFIFATKLDNPAVCTGADEIRKALRRIGLDNHTAHDLRHTNATLALELGATPVQVRDRLGQASLQATAIYTHGTTQGDQAIARTLSDYFSELDDNVVPIRKRVS